jgi:hypothetical protein
MTRTVPLLIVFFVVATAVFSEKTIAMDFHIAIANDTTTEGRENTSYVDHTFRKEHLYLLLNVNDFYSGHHGIVGHEQRLVALSNDGNLNWKEYLPKGARYIHPNKNGFLVVAVDKGENPKYGSQYRELTVWQVDENGGGPRNHFQLKGHLLLQDSHYDKDRLSLVLGFYDSSGSELQLQPHLFDTDLKESLI